MSETRPNIIWITLDSVRYDHTSATSDRNTTPHIERIATSDRGTHFSQCIAHSYWTRGSVASILTGTYPSHHGVGMKRGQTLPPDLDTLPELFAAEGYSTACVSENGLVGPALDLDRGFQRYRHTSLRNFSKIVRSNPRAAGTFLWNLRHQSGGFTMDGQKHSLSHLSTEITKRQLRTLTTESDPFFIYVHFNDPHRPYYPTTSYRERFGKQSNTSMAPDELAEFSLEVHENLYQIVANGCDLTADELDSLRSMYDAEIAHTDQYVGELFEFVRENVDRETIFIVTADHGELFGEHGLLAHKITLDDALIRVPLVVHGFEEINHQKDELVQHADIVRTLAAAAGIGTDQFQGVDLRSEKRPFAVAERSAEDYQKDLDELTKHNANFDSERFIDGDVVAVRTSEYKFVNGDTEALFELPDEETDISEERADLTAEFEKNLAEWKEKVGDGDYERTTREFSDSMKRHLSDLGYLVD